MIKYSFLNSQKQLHFKIRMAHCSTDQNTQLCSYMQTNFLTALSCQIGNLTHLI